MMTNQTNPFADTVSEFDDRRLLSIIRSPEDFSPKLVDASRTEAEKRGLNISTNAQHSQEKSIDYLSIVRRRLSQGVSIDKCEQYLLNEGLSQDETLTVLDQAVRTAALKKENTQVKQDSDGPGIWTILFIIFIVIRLLIRFAN